jgi:hypothetical protein
MNSIKQRHYDKVASNWLFVGLFVGYAVLFFSPFSPSESAAWQRTSTRVGHVGAFAFLIYQYYCIRQGKQWAKYLLVAGFVGGLLLFALNFHNVMHKLNSPLKVVNFVFGYLLQAGALFWVFRYKFIKD